MEGKEIPRKRAQAAPNAVLGSAARKKQPMQGSMQTSAPDAFAGYPRLLKLFEKTLGGKFGIFKESLEFELNYAPSTEKFMDGILHFLQKETPERQKTLVQKAFAGMKNEWEPGFDERLGRLWDSIFEK